MIPLTYMTSTNYYCNLCHGPLFKELGHWWHRWKEDGDKCNGPDHVLTMNEVRSIEMKERTDG